MVTTENESGTIVGQILQQAIETTVDKVRARQSAIIVNQILRLTIDTAVDRSSCIRTSSRHPTPTVIFDDPLSDSSATSSCHSSLGASTSSCIQSRPTAIEDVDLIDLTSEESSATSSCHSSLGASKSSILNSRPTVIEDVDLIDLTSEESKLHAVQTHPVWKVQALANRKLVYSCTFPDLLANLRQIVTINRTKFLRLDGRREQKKVPGISVPIQLFISYDLVELFPPKVNVFVFCIFMR
jgi:hypothetical protein